MPLTTLSRLLLVSLFAIAACQSADEQAVRSSTVVTLLFTNDVESAYDPIPAFWLDDQEMIGGIAEMTNLINEIRDKEPNVFLFDAGDIFTGALAKLTEGRTGILNLVIAYPCVSRSASNPALQIATSGQ